MDIKKAIEINTKVIAYVFWSSGYTSSRPGFEITESLSELVRACSMVRELSKEKKRGLRPLCINDRTIAAIYTSIHFTPEMSIIAKSKGGVLMLVPNENLNIDE